MERYILWKIGEEEKRGMVICAAIRLKTFWKKDKANEERRNPKEQTEESEKPERAGEDETGRLSKGISKIQGKTDSGDGASVGRFSRRTGNSRDCGETPGFPRGRAGVGEQLRELRRRCADSLLPRGSAVIATRMDVGVSRHPVTAGIA